MHFPPTHHPSPLNTLFYTPRSHNPLNLYVQPPSLPTWEAIQQRNELGQDRGIRHSFVLKLNRPHDFPIRKLVDLSEDRHPEEAVFLAYFFLDVHYSFPFSRLHSVRLSQPLVSPTQQAPSSFCLLEPTFFFLLGCTSLTMQTERVKPTLKRTKFACVNCKAAKAACDSNRPCAWYDMIYIMYINDKREYKGR